MSKLFSVLLAASALLASIGSAIAEPTAEAVVQAQLEAYNKRDIDAFVATYTDDVELFALPDRLLMRGAAELRKHYTKTFADERLHATIVNRIVLGNTVIDHERVRLTFPEGPGTLEAVAIYEVRDGKIARVWFRRGDTKLDAPAPNP